MRRAMPGNIRKPSNLYTARAANKAPTARINPLAMGERHLCRTRVPWSMAREFGSEEPWALGNFLQMQDQGLQRGLLIPGRKVGPRCHHLPLAYRAPGFFRAAQHLLTPVLHADFCQVVAANQYAIVGGGQQCGFEQALIVAQQIDGAESALGPGGRIEQYQVVLALLQAWIARQLLPAPLGDRDR